MLLSSPGDLLTRALTWFSSEKGGRGQPPVNVRRVGKRHNIVNSRQTDFGFGADDRAGPGSPSSPVLIFLNVPVVWGSQKLCLASQLLRNCFIFLYLIILCLKISGKCLQGIMYWAHFCILHWCNECGCMCVTVFLLVPGWSIVLKKTIASQLQVEDHDTVLNFIFLIH